MIIVNSGKKIKLEEKYKKKLDLLLLKLKSANFADEIVYEISDFDLKFSCIFITNSKESIPYKTPVHKLGKLTNNLSLLEEHSKKIENIDELN